MHPIQVEHRIDLPDQMIRRHNLVEIKHVKELPLLTLSLPHHGPLRESPSELTESRFAHRLNESFATQSPTLRTQPRTSREVREVPDADNSSGECPGRVQPRL